MNYYRLIFKYDKEEGSVAFSDIVEHPLDDETLNSMVWDKPIVRHYDGEFLHLVALDKTYLEAMVAGIAVYKDVEKWPEYNQ